LSVTVYRAADELQNEAKAHVLKHINVVTLYAMIFEPQHYGVVLEFVPHGCLEEFIYKNKVLFNHYASVVCNTSIYKHLHLHFPVFILLPSAQHDDRCLFSKTRWCLTNMFKSSLIMCS